MPVRRAALAAQKDGLETERLRDFPLRVVACKSRSSVNDTHQILLLLLYWHK